MTTHIKSWNECGIAKNINMYFPTTPKDEILMECDTTISSLKKLFTTPQYSLSEQLMHKNCNCNCPKSNYSVDGEKCDSNTCPSNLLLQGSDDPLIGHGANSFIDDDHPIELRALQLQQHLQIQPLIISAAASSTRTTSAINTTTTNWSDIVKEKLKTKTQAKVYALQNQQKQQKQIKNCELNKDK